MSRADPFRRGTAIALAACAFVISMRAQAALEYDVKAALLLNFARFIEWPPRAFADASSPVSVCVLAPNPFGDALERALQGETVGQRSFVVREVRDAGDTTGCHLLFVPSGSESRAGKLMRQTGTHTITVGESRRFEGMGGAVNFVLDEGRVRFNVNLRPVEERGVRISARMLQLASRVDRVTPEK
jgi:hypothetical protein